jgi:hypothetical protein
MQHTLLNCEIQTESGTMATSAVGSCKSLDSIQMDVLKSYRQDKDMQERYGWVKRNLAIMVRDDT